MSDDYEEYILPCKVFEKAKMLRAKGKWSWKEIADKLKLNLDDLIHDVKLHQHELDSMDD